MPSTIMNDASNMPVQFCPITSESLNRGRTCRSLIQDRLRIHFQRDGDDRAMMSARQLVGPFAAQPLVHSGLRQVLHAMPVGVIEPEAKTGGPLACHCAAADKNARLAKKE